LKALDELIISASFKIIDDFIDGGKMDPSNLIRLGVWLMWLYMQKYPDAVPEDIEKQFELSKEIMRQKRPEDLGK
jgi:hypothetical protein